MAEYDVIGLMSGSSLDGLDICRVKFFTGDNGTFFFQMQETACYEYDEAFRSALRALPGQSAFELARAHMQTAKVFGQLVNQFLHQYPAARRSALLVSHGQTIFHQPEQGFTCQIGCGATLATVTGMTVVSDLRSKDVSLGGQGAPLVPLGEQFLFPSYRQFLNIGGICNISMHGTDGVRAFDVCPGNTLLNYFAEKCGAPYDYQGALARSGRVHEELLVALNHMPFYQKAGARSLGTEHIVAKWLPLFEQYSITAQDALNTAVEHIALQVGRVANRERLLITGGGAFNTFLVERLSALLPCSVEVPEDEIVSYKEALIMAFLGLRRILQTPNALASVTGAARDSIGGAVYLPG